MSKGLQSCSTHRYSSSTSVYVVISHDHDLFWSLWILPWAYSVHWRTLILHHFVLRPFQTCVTSKSKWTTPSVIPRIGNLRTLRLLSTKNLVTLVYIDTATTSPPLVTTLSRSQTVGINQTPLNHAWMPSSASIAWMVSLYIRNVANGLSQFISVKISKLHIFPSSVLSPSSDHETIQSSLLRPRSQSWQDSRHLCQRCWASRRQVAEHET